MKPKKEKIGLGGLISIGIGSVIGAGIFSMMGTGIAYTGRSVWIALIVATLWVFGQNFRPYVLSSMFALDGGRYEQAAMTTPPILSGATAANFLMQNLSRSVMAIGIAQYIAALVPAAAGHIKLVAFVVMTAAFAVSLLGNSFLAKLQSVVVVCMYLSLSLFAVFGILNRNPSVYEGEAFFHGGAAGFLAAVITISYACQGSANIIDVTKNAEQAKRDIPRAQVIATIAVAVLYAVLGYAATCSMPYAAIAGESLGIVAKSVMPKAFYLFFVIGGAIGALVTTLLGCIAAMPWPIFSAAKDGWLPEVFTRQTKSGYPWVVMLTMYLIAIVPILGGFSLSTIVSYLLVPGAILVLAGNIINFHLPEQFPEAWENRSVKLSKTGYRVVMVISCILNLITALISLSTLDSFNLVCNLCMTALTFIYPAYRIKAGKVKINAQKE